MKTTLLNQDTIVALATPQGHGAIGLIRISGNETFTVCSNIAFSKSGKKIDLSAKAANSVVFCLIMDGETVIDEVLISIFKTPASYTGQDIIEISCHGSLYIQQKIIHLLLKQGARLAQQGEFTMRAFLNGKFDLSQAEAVADLISSNSAASHKLAMQQMRGGFSDKIKSLRQKLIDFASLIELELDFAEEDVEFANRSDLKALVNAIQEVVRNLIDSFEVGNVIKNGIPVAIVGKPNAGKSTLLNVLLEENRAIVSEIPGTTRDIIEDQIIIDGVLFRFIDTAGIRQTNDLIETMGVEKTFEQIKLASIVIYLFDVNDTSAEQLKQNIDEINSHLNSSHLLVVANKTDNKDISVLKNKFKDFTESIYISAKEQSNIDDLKKQLIKIFADKTTRITDTIVSNARHADALEKTNEALTRVLDGLNNNITGDFLAMDIRQALYYLGSITGEISSDDLLSNIFSRFCIGK